MINAPEQLKTVEQKLEEAQNKMLLLDQNYDRIKRLHDSEQTQVRSLQDVKSTLEASNKDLIFANEKLTAENLILTNQKADLEKDMSGARSILSHINQEIKAQSDVHIESHKKLEAVSEKLSQKEQDITDRENAVTQKEQDLNEKHDKIRLFIETL
jgi:predicted  nucleic acid-binding Zn-ribbon protein